MRVDYLLGLGLYLAVQLLVAGGMLARFWRSYVDRTEAERELADALRDHAAALRGDAEPKSTRPRKLPR